MTHQIDDTILKTYTAEEVDAAAVLFLQQQMERWTITNIYAPMKRRKQAGILKRYTKAVAQVGDDSKAAITALSAQLETGIKGQFSKKVSQTVIEKAKAYDKL